MLMVAKPLRSWRPVTIASFLFACLFVGTDSFAIPTDELLRSLRPTADVNDFAGILTAEQKNALEEKCRQVRQQTGAELAVVVVKSLEGGQVDDFAVKLFEHWKIGKAGKDNGVLLLVAIQDRKARIEVGYGLEPILPDILAGQILREQLFPEFRQQKYFEGLSATVNRIAEIIQRNEPAHVAKQPPAQHFSPGGILIFCFFLFVLSVPPAYAAGNLLRFGDVPRAISQLPGPGIALLLSLLLGSPFIATIGVIISSLIAGVFGFASDQSGGNSRGRRYRRSSPGWFGGPFSSGGGTTWGGGGFSGGAGGSWGGFGGGRSGGGGASGGW